MSASEREEKDLQAAALKLKPETGDFEDIFNRHASRVFRSAYRVVGNASDAEDVLQNVFMRLLKRDSAPHLGDNPQAYLNRSAVNAALDLLRSRRSARAVSLDSVAAQADRGPGPEEHRRASELRDCLRSAVAQLNPTSAEMFVLRYSDGYGNQEIAQMLGTTQGTVAVTLHRARTRLKEDLSRLLTRNQQP